MNHPLVRVLPPTPGTLAADAEAPYVVVVAGEVPDVALPEGTLREEGERTRFTGSRTSLLELANVLPPGVGDALRRALTPARAWRLRTRRLSLERPVVMGILNLTSDSFSGDGVGADLSEALRRAEQLRSDGADLIDVGAESARADRPVMGEEAEARLAEAAITELVREGHVVSADTYKPLVARAALEAGAEVVNDISGLTLGTGAAAEAARSGAGYVLNYSYSVPKRRPDSPPRYEDVVVETLVWMEERLRQLDACGLARETIAIDPGIAFGKSHDEDIEVIRRLGEFRSLGQPVLLAHSRKNLVGSVTGTAPGERDLETHVLSAMAYVAGARIFRVHDAAGARRALDMASALVDGRRGDFAPDGESWPWRAGASAPHMTVAPPDKSAPGGQRW